MRVGRPEDVLKNASWPQKRAQHTFYVPAGIRGPPKYAS